MLFLVFPMIILPCHKSENNLFLLIHFSYRNCSFKVKSKTLSLIISWCEKRAIEMLKKDFTPFLKIFLSRLLIKTICNVGFCGLFGYIKHSSFIDLIITKWPALKISALVKKGFQIASWSYNLIIWEKCRPQFWELSNYKHYSVHTGPKSENLIRFLKRSLLPYQMQFSLASQ